MLANLGSLAGLVFLDTGGDGAFTQGQDSGIPGVVVTLTGTSTLIGKTDPQQVNLVAVTDDDGRYKFTGLGAGNFTLKQTQPGAWKDGNESTGSPAGQTSDNQIVLANYPDDTVGTGYNFAELAISPEFVSKRLFLNTDSQATAFRSINASMMEQGGSPSLANGIRLKTMPSEVAYSGATSTTVTPTPVNNPPENIALTPASVSENSPVGTPVGTLSATDRESNVPIRFELSNDGVGTFELIGAEIRVKSSALLDFELRQSIPITVVAIDSSDARGFKTLNIEVTNVNEPPGAVTPTSFSVLRDAAAGFVIGTLQPPTDPDGDPVTLSIPTNNTFELVSNQLRLKSVLGSISTPQTVIVTASDGKGLETPTTISVSIDSINRAPGLVTPTQFSIPRSASAGTVVGTVQKPTDPDGDPVTLTLENGRFEINGEGQIRVKSALGTEPFHVIEVKATDNKGASTPTTITISTTISPPSNVTPNTFSIPENSDVGTVVGTVQAMDPDGDAVTYSLSSDATGTFEIANGNQLRVKNNSLLDFEARQTLLPVVRASDGNGGTSDTTITVSITNMNEPPVKSVQLPARDVFEDAPAIEIPLLGLFSDPEDSTDPKDSELTFAASSDAATIVETSIVGNVLRLSVKPDANTGSGSPVNVVLSASDNTNSTSQTFAVTVRPVNDKPTVSVLEQISIPEDSGPQEVSGFVINQFPGPANESSQQVTLSVTNFTNDIFTANGKPRIENGRLLFTPAPNAVGESILTIRARDEGGIANGGEDTSDPADTSIIKITSVDDEPTGITLTPGTIQEDAQVGAVVGQLLVSDPDIGDSYSFALANSSSNRFMINGSQVTLANNVGLQELQVLDIDVIATRVNAPSVTLQRKLTVTVTAPSTSRTLTIGTKSVNGASPQTVLIPINVSQTKDVLGIDLAIKYDTARLNLFNDGGRPIASVKLGNELLTRGWQLTWSVNDQFSENEGIVVISITNTTPLPELNGLTELVTLDFDVTAGPGSTATLSWIANDGVRRTELNEDQFRLSLVNGQIQIQ